MKRRSEYGCCTTSHEEIPSFASDQREESPYVLCIRQWSNSACHLILVLESILRYNFLIDSYHFFSKHLTVKVIYYGISCIDAHLL